MSISTIPYRVELAADAINNISANTFLGIGKGSEWTSNDADIISPNQSIDYTNQVRRDLVALKKIYASDCSLVVQRVDWVANTIYTSYSNTVDMYATTEIVNANGTVNVNTGTTIINGVNTTFQLDYSNNDILTFSGDGVYVLPEFREIINVVSNTQMIVNASFSSAYVANTPMKVVDYAPYYANDFYVRNSFDQVFVCLSNNFGVESTDMPKISLGGQLPSNPYIIAADGYLWKYLYTMSGGMKQLFFTSEWMPVMEDSTVELAATNGRLDVIQIIDGGTGYNNSAAEFNAPILNVIGDGTGANLTAQVDANGTIYGINILNGGAGYTTATITANTGVTGTGAIIQAVIGPQGGWGSNAATELGATNMMISVTLDDTENDTIPTDDALGDFFSYRQISLIDSPVLTATSNVANSINYDLTTVIQMSSNSPFAMQDVVYQSPNPPYDLANATFTAYVIYFDYTFQELHINNIKGTFSTALPLYDANNSKISATAFNFTSPVIDIFSGNLNFIENREAITRSPGQTENIKIILQF